MPAEVSPYSGTALVRVDVAHIALSPALRSASAGGRSAFEIKMALELQVAHDLEKYFASNMQCDPYAALCAGPVLPGDDAIYRYFSIRFA